MTRVRNVLAIAFPSLVIGALVFGNATGHAAAGNGNELGYWPAVGDVVTGDIAKRRDTWTAPTPPTPPPPPSIPNGPPPPPPPPRAVGGGKRGGVSISIHGDRIEITGIRELVTEKLEGVREMLRKNPNIPDRIRDKIVRRIDRVQGVLDARLKNLRVTDIDKLDEQMERLGEELEQALAGLDDELAKIGDRSGKDIAKQVTKDLKRLGKQTAKARDSDRDSDADSSNNNDNDNDNDGADPAAPDDDHDGDVSIDVGDLKGFALKPAQRDAIAKLKADSEVRVAEARKQLDDASQKLETALGDPRTSDADVSRLVDQVSTQEAVIRKAKLLTWLAARRVLDQDQVKKLESVVQRGHHR